MVEAPMQMTRRDNLTIRVALTFLGLIVIACLIGTLVLTTSGNKSAAWFPLAVCGVILFSLVARLFYLYWSTIRKPSNAEQPTEGTERFTDSNGRVFSVMPSRADIVYADASAPQRDFMCPENFEPLSGIPMINRGINPHTRYQIQIVFNNSTTDEPPNYRLATSNVLPTPFDEAPPKYEDAVQKEIQEL